MTRSVLLVDDNLSVTQIIKALLRRFDFEVETTTDPNQVLSMLENQSFDLVISDVMMPGTDGYTLGRQIRAKGKTANLPIIYLTALDSMEDQFEAWLSGADAFMTKPFKAQDLLKTIDGVLTQGKRKSTPLKTDRFKAPVVRPRVVAAVLERDRRRVLTAAMRIADCDLEITEEVGQALQKLDREQFHALIVDTRLGGGTPAEIADFLRYFSLAVPVIFLHDKGKAPDLKGANDHFSTFAMPDTPAVLGAYVLNAINDCGWAG
ncbi:MAG: response regulator [Planctomycetes bacterium]|nr:response regulator [Planctomycetota bacterium]